MQTDVIREKQVNVKLSPDEFDRLERLAAHYSVSEQNVIRMLIKERYDEIHSHRAVDEDEVFDRACYLLRRHETRWGAEHQQPSKAASGFEGLEYVLRNVRGELARFVMKDGKWRMKPADDSAE